MQIKLSILFIGLILILAGAGLFTNAIEWLGKKLKLAEGAVGSILAAVGTALPETMIPIMAILFSGDVDTSHIGIGAILGAPFMLATLAFFISGLAVLINRKRRNNFPFMNIDTIVMSRDLKFFLIVYLLAILASFLSTHKLKIFVAVLLVLAYVFYVYLTLNYKGKVKSAKNINPLFFARKKLIPRLKTIIFQIFISLCIIIMGAKFFVSAVEDISKMFEIPAFILALVIAPVATELPEKFNSIIWISSGKDTLALGNITGAMVFQSSLIAALGILLTSWNLNLSGLISAVLALASAFIVYFQIKVKKKLSAYSLLFGGVFYFVFLLLVCSKILF